MVFWCGSRPWQRWHIGNRLQLAAWKAKIVNFAFHDLRHTVASRLRRNGADMEDNERVLGHTNIQTRKGRVHYEAEQLRPVLALLDRARLSTKEAQEMATVFPCNGNSTE